tara:strand:- start:1434 stop:1985 length:552 start_codon:yes stop_codon:yes gene_type:complete
MKTINDKLVDIQSRLKAPKNQYNSFGKYYYRNVEDILEALKPLLKEHNLRLNLNDEVIQLGDLYYIDSYVTIADGDKTISVKAQAGININKKGMDIAQSFGSSSSYARKYALNGLFLIDDNKDPDATNETKKVDTTKANGKPWLTEAQLQATLKSNKDKAINVLDSFNMKTEYKTKINQKFNI